MLAELRHFDADFVFLFAGPAVIRGLAEIVERRPNDPIEYLANYLYKQVENERAHQQVRFRLHMNNERKTSVLLIQKIEEAKQLEIEKEQAEQEKVLRAQLKRERQALREREENERKEREAEEARRREAEELAKR